MSSTQSLYLLSSMILLSACTTALINTAAEHMPSDQSPQQLIDTKQLNGNTNGGKEYYAFDIASPIVSNSSSPVYLPYSCMQKHCISQSGQFKQLAETALTEMKKQEYPLDRLSQFKQKMGVFTCNTPNRPWSVSIEPQYSRKGGMAQNLVFVGIKMRILDNIVAQNQANAINTIHRQRQGQIAEQRQRQQDGLAQAKRDQAARQFAHQRYIQANAPTLNDIGRTICKETLLGGFTGLVIMGQAQYQPMQGTVIGSLENISPGRNNLKIILKGWLNGDRIESGSHALYQQTPLESVKVIWDDKMGWYKCSY